MEIYHVLRKLLPNIDLTTNYQDQVLLRDSSSQSEQKLIMLLINHFDSQKIKYVDSHTIETEAKYINQLFPKLERSYILEQLDLFKDMPQRVEIVLRTIVYSKICKVSTNHSPMPSIKRTIPTQNKQMAVDLNGYCKPIKIRKITDGTKSTYEVNKNMEIATTLPNNYWVPSTEARLIKPDIASLNVIRNAEKRIVIKYLPTAKSCTVTSVTAVPQVQNEIDIVEDIDVKPMVEPLNIPEETLGTINTQNTNDNCDSSCQITKPPLPSTNSSVVSSSDEILNFVKSDEENVSTSNEQLNNVDSAILKTNENCIKTQEAFGDAMQLVDEYTLPVAQNCTVNSSNEATDVIHKAPYLDFLSEIVVPDPSTMSVNSSNFTSDTNEILPPITEEAEGEKESKENQPQTGGEDFEDSDKTVFYSGLSLDHFSNEGSSVDNDIMTDKEKVLINDESIGSEGQYVNNVPSTSKQSDMSEDFDLIEYLREITNAPLVAIIKQCTRLNLPPFKKPSLQLLEIAVDNLLSNNISSENSDNDENDPDAVKIIAEQKPQSTSVSPKRLKSLIENTEPKTKLFVAMSAGGKQSELESTKTDVAVNTQLVNYLCGIFPDACPIYIKRLCKEKPMNNEVVDQLTTEILNSNGQYPKRPVVQPEPDVFPKNQFEILTEFLPDADPDYLRMMCDRFEGKPDLVKTFLNNAMERRDYPTLKEYQRRQQLSAQQKQYTTEFNVENFIKLIPDPHKFFFDSTRIVTMDALSSHYALVFLRNTFSKLPVRVIQSTFTKNSCSLSKTYRELQKIMLEKHLLMKSTRKPTAMPNGIQNIPLLQEVAYFSHLKEINNYLQQIKEKEESERQEALSKGLMKTCNCCYDEEVLPRDIFTCESGCSFCKSCIVKSTEVRFGEGKLDFPCLMNCQSKFSLQTLQAVLSPKLFSKIAQKKALEEVKAAGIEELETCPFCDFATIPAAGYSIFSCLNPDCMKESCRFCKEPSHIPFKCDEIEKDADVKARTFVENQMTEALLKKCWKCGIKFFKEEGCNKMTCSCGSSMCYVCGKPVTDYKHFNGNGGDRFDLCPLYSDTNVLNKQNVLKAAEQAKAEIGVSLKHDPTVDIDKHYKERASKFPQQQLLAQQQRQAEVFLGRMRDALERLEHHRQRPF